MSPNRKYNISVIDTTPFIQNKFLVRFFISYHLHKYRLVSAAHRINAAFGVSKAFVPYRMPYSQALALLSTRAPSGIADYVASGSVNDLPSGCALCNPNVSGMPALADNYFIIRTRIYDANCAEQEAVAPAGNRRFNRTKWGGTWTSWEEYTLKS